jgi:hypothetical protein
LPIRNSLELREVRAPRVPLAPKLTVSFVREDQVVAFVFGEALADVLTCWRIASKGREIKSDCLEVELDSPEPVRKQIEVWPQEACPRRAPAETLAIE